MNNWLFHVHLNTLVQVFDWVTDSGKLEAYLARSEAKNIKTKALVLFTSQPKSMLETDDT